LQCKSKYQFPLSKAPRQANITANDCCCDCHRKGSP
jgi:hypothetical protein